MPDDELDLNPRKKGRGKIVILLIMLFLIGFLMSVLVFNAFNIREKYFRNIINSIPVINNLLPEPEKETEEEYTSLTAEELQYKIRQLQKQITTQEEDIKNLTTINEELNLENKRLKEIESQQLEFKEAKEKFDTMIAENDPEAYVEFYEQIYPETAEKLYVSAKTNVEKEKELKKYVSTFSEMEADAAASIMNEMVQTDINLVVLILKNLDNEQRGNILAEMEASKAALAVKRLAPETALN